VRNPEQPRAREGWPGLADMACLRPGRVNNNARTMRLHGQERPFAKSQAIVQRITISFACPPAMSDVLPCGDPEPESAAVPEAGRHLPPLEPRSRCGGSAHRSIGPDVSRGSEPLSIPATWRSKPGLAPQGPPAPAEFGVDDDSAPCKSVDCRKVSVGLEIHLLRLSWTGKFHPSHAAPKPTRR
jgi:hypothetical protein